MVAGLTAVALSLMAVGLAAIVFDTGFAGAGQPRSAGANSTAPRAGSPSYRFSATPLVSSSPGSGFSASPVPVSSASPTISVSPTPRTVGFGPFEKGFAYFADDGSITPVQPVPDLEVRIQTGKAVYYALAANRYLLKAGSYAGEFIPQVTIGQADGSSAQTGGVVLAGPVVAKMISDRLAAAASDSDRWVVALPVDIRTLKTGVDVSFDQFGLSALSNTPRVVVRFQGTLPVVESVPTNGGYHVLVEGLGVTAWQIIDPIRLTLPPAVIDPKHAMNQLLIYGTGDASTAKNTYVDSKTAVGTTIVSVADEVCVSLVVDGSRADIDSSRVLKVGDVPVFVAKN